jgi:hypothetical protein
MIKATELRIGNWVTTNPMLHQVVEINIYSVVINRVPMNNLRRADESREFRPLNKSTLAHDLSEIYPILLTSELLEKFGFKEHPMHDSEGNEVGYYYYHPSDFVLNEQQEQNTPSLYFQDGPKKVFIHHLHQLQNLFFDLTGEEL